MTKLIVFYDNWCPNCTRFSQLVQKFDWLKRIDFKELRNFEHTNEHETMDLNLAKQQMAALTTKWNYGYNSLCHIFFRIPLLWLLFPFFYFLKITGLGQYLYIQLALKRKIIPLACDENSCSI